MLNTLVIQSHTQPLPSSWLAKCIDSVKTWSHSNKYDYVFHDDSLFDYINQNLLVKLKNQLIIATDLARLNLLQHYLDAGYKTVVWCDVDFLIFKPNELNLLDANFALGREVWIQHSDTANVKLSCHRKVHNAFMMYRNNNTFLKFYIETAERLLEANKGRIPPQFIGPKLLTALHNIIHCPVIETAGMLSPLIIQDIINDGGDALDLFNKNSSIPICAANLCNSLYLKGELNDIQIKSCIDKLLSDEIQLFI